MQGSGRYSNYWDKSYIFAASDGKVGVFCSASDYTADGITEFAKRLQVPIRGDFTVKMQHRTVPPST